MTTSDAPRVPYVALGVDVGGSKVTAVAVSDTIENAWSKTYPTSSFPSPLVLLRQICSELGSTPIRITLGLPGNSKDGRVDCANIPTWKNLRLHPTDIERALRCDPGSVRLLNDMQIAELGLRLLRTTLPVLKQGRPSEELNAGVATVSTGMNEAVAPAAAVGATQIATSREVGWGPLGLPFRDDEIHLLIRAFEKWNTPNCREFLLSGGRGFRNVLWAAYDVLHTSGVDDPQRKVWRERLPNLDALVDLMDQPNLGQLVTEGAMNNDPIYTQVADMWCMLLGCYLRGFIIDDNLTYLAIQGSALNATPDFAAKWAFREGSPLWKQLLRPGDKDYLVAEATIYAVPNDANMAATGAAYEALDRLD